MKVFSITIIGLVALIIITNELIGKKESSEESDTATYKGMEYTLSKIAGKNLSEVESYLGKFTKSEKVNPLGVSCPCRKYYFKGDEIEIVFINDKADWITISKPSWLNVDVKKYQDLMYFESYTYVKIQTP